MIALRQHVERIVRPLRASELRKDRMREELLAHLRRLYDEESAAGSDDNAALLRAMARFGDAQALGSELQATVPVLERLLFRPLPGSRWQERRRPGESVAAFVRRVAPPIVGFHTVMWLTFIGVLLFIGQRRPMAPAINVPWMVALNVAYLVLFPLLTFGNMLVGEQIHLSLRNDIDRLGVDGAGAKRPRRWGRAALYAALTSLSLVGPVAAFMAMFNMATGIDVFTGRLFWGVVGGGVAVSLPVAALQVLELRRFDQWTGLDLSSACERPASAELSAE